MSDQSSDVKQPSVLVVDDQGPMRTVVGDLLGMLFPNSLVLRAGDGAKALVMFARHRPRIVLMDVRLPDEDGIELGRQIKALAPDTILIVISMDNAAHTRDRALAAGASAFIPKDCLFVELEPLLADIERVGACQP